MRMIITGVSGLLGSNFAYYFRNNYSILGLYNNNPVCIKGVMTDKCDITQEVIINNIFKDFNPDIVIHCASLTNIDKCETNQETSNMINVLGTRNIVKALEHFDSKLMYISTDSVYDGVRGFFSEEDRVNPKNYYGLSKRRRSRRRATCQ